MMLPALEDHPSGFLKEARADYLFFHTTWTLFFHTTTWNTTELHGDSHDKGDSGWSAKLAFSARDSPSLLLTWLWGCEEEEDPQRNHGANTRKTVCKTLVFQRLRSLQGCGTAVVNACWFCREHQRSRLDHSHGGSPWRWIAKELTQHPGWCCSPSRWPQGGFSEAKEWLGRTDTWITSGITSHEGWLLAAVALFRLITRK